jgi:hypothetical protein
VFFPRFSAELVFSALKDTPVVIVTALGSAARPHWSAIWSRAIANSSPTKYREFPTFLGPSRSQSMKIAVPAGSC